MNLMTKHIEGAILHADKDNRNWLVTLQGKSSFNVNIEMRIWYLFREKGEEFYMMDCFYIVHMSD